MENISISNCNIHLHGDVYIGCAKKNKMNSLYHVILQHYL